MTERWNRRLVIPIAPGESIAVEGLFPLSETGWTQFAAVLEAMRPGLVHGDDQESRTASQGGGLSA